MCYNIGIGKADEDRRRSCMEWVYDDGGRSRHFKAEHVGDCVCRAIAIATGRDYKEVYDDINRLAKSERTGKRKRGTSSARDGVYRSTFKKLLESEYGWEWHPTMGIGTGCRVHVREDELPSGPLVLSLSRHVTAVIDGELHDTYDCSREGTRCVYGYWAPPSQKLTSAEFLERVRGAAEDYALGLLSSGEFGRQCEALALDLRNDRMSR